MKAKRMCIAGAVLAMAAIIGCKNAAGDSADLDTWTPIEQVAPVNLLGTWKGTATQTIPADQEIGLFKNSSMSISITMTLSLTQMSITEVISVKKYLLDWGGTEEVAQYLWEAMKGSDTWAEEDVTFSDADMTITYRQIESLDGSVEIGGNKSASNIYINGQKNKLKIVPAPGEDAGISQIILQKV